MLAKTVEHMRNSIPHNMLCNIRQLSMSYTKNITIKSISFTALYDGAIRVDLSEPGSSIMTQSKIQLSLYSYKLLTLESSFKVILSSFLTLNPVQSITIYDKLLFRPNTETVCINTHRLGENQPSWRPRFLARLPKEGVLMAYIRRPSCRPSVRAARNEGYVTAKTLNI